MNDDSAPRSDLANLLNGHADTSALLSRAGRDPDELVTKFVMEDVAAALLDAVNRGDLAADRAVLLLRHADASKLGDLICDVSHWPEAFVDYLDATVARVGN
jgi:hypothetical protein